MIISRKIRVSVLRYTGSGDGLPDQKDRKSKK